VTHPSRIPTDYNNTDTKLLWAVAKTADVPPDEGNLLANRANLLIGGEDWNVRSGHDSRMPIAVPLVAIHLDSACYATTNIADGSEPNTVERHHIRTVWLATVPLAQDQYGTRCFEKIPMLGPRHQKRRYSGGHCGDD